MGVKVIVVVSLVEVRAAPTYEGLLVVITSLWLAALKLVLEVPSLPLTVNKVFPTAWLRLSWAICRNNPVPPVAGSS